MKLSRDSEEVVGGALIVGGCLVMALIPLGVAACLFALAFWLVFG